MTKGFEEGAANTRTCAFHKQMNGACLVGSNLDRLRNCSRTLVVERPRALRKRMKDDERNENVMANGDRPSPMPMVRSGGTRPVRLMLDSGCFKRGSSEESFTVGSGFHQAESIWWDRMVRSGSPALPSLQPDTSRLKRSLRRLLPLFLRPRRMRPFVRIIWHVTVANIEPLVS